MHSKEQTLTLRKKYLGPSGRASRYGGVDAFEEFVDKFGEIQVVTINKVIAVGF